MTRPKVLIVDDEEPIVMGLARRLFQDNARYDVMVAFSAEVAQAIMAENAIQVLVTDIHLPGRSGLDLICWAATASPQTRVIVTTAHDVVEFRDRAYRFGCLEIVQKPFDLHEMRRLVIDALANKEGIQGTLDALAPADIVQMLCLNQRSVALRVVEGGSSGVLHIDRGEIVHALIDDDVGEAAAYRILRSRRGLFHTLPLPSGAPRSVNMSWQHLLMEAMRLEDELGTEVEGASTRVEDASIPVPQSSKASEEEQMGADRPQPKASDTWDLVVERTQGADQRASEVSALIDRGLEAARAREYDRARELWAEALDLDPGNRMVELNLRRLSRMQE